jgi:hypothetical protein
MDGNANMSFIPNPKYQIKTRWFTLFQEAPGVISPRSCWVLFYSSHGHFNESLLKLLWEAFTEFKNDKHLVM